MSVSLTTKLKSFVGMLEKDDFKIFETVMRNRSLILRPRMCLLTCPLNRLVRFYRG